MKLKKEFKNILHKDYDAVIAVTGKSNEDILECATAIEGDSMKLLMILSSIVQNLVKDGMKKELIRDAVEIGIEEGETKNENV